MSIHAEIWKRIKKYDHIIITSHLRADGDCVGSAIGLREIIKATFPKKDVKAIHENIDYLSFLGKSDEATDEEFKNALVISVDDANVSRAVDQRLTTGLELIKIDHHPNVEPFGTTINFVEEEKVACAEMIIDMFLVNKAKITPLGVEALFTGLVTDSGNFKYPGVTYETMYKVSMLYKLGLDAQKVYLELGRTTLEELNFKGWVLQNIKRTPNGVLYIKITPEDRERFNVSYDQASNMVNSMSGVDGSLIWILINEYNSDEIRCRVRSVKVPINEISASFGGGGHANASGIVVKSYEIVDQILDALDKVLKDYKELNI